MFNLREEVREGRGRGMIWLSLLSGPGRRFEVNGTGDRVRATWWEAIRWRKVKDNASLNSV